MADPWTYLQEDTPSPYNTEFDSFWETWTRKTPLETGVASMAVAPTRSFDDAYAIGGFKYLEPAPGGNANILELTNDVLYYRPFGDSWVTSTPMDDDCGEAAACTLGLFDVDIFVFGGIRFSAITNVTLHFDVDFASWSVSTTHEGMLRCSATKETTSAALVTGGYYFSTAAASFESFITEAFTARDTMGTGKEMHGSATIG